MIALLLIMQSSQTGFGSRVIDLCRLEPILTPRKKQMHYQGYQRMLRNLPMKFKKSIRNSRHLIIFYSGKIGAPADLHMTNKAAIDATFCISPRCVNCFPAGIGIGWGYLRKSLKPVF